MQQLKNKTAFITGANKGIGKATAIKLAKEGVNLGFIGRNEAELKTLCHELEKEYGIKAVYATADVSVKEEAEAAAESLIASLGKVDILVNNAGIASFGTLLEMDPEEWERIIRVNLMGTYYVTRKILPAILEQNEGSIINVSSTAGEKGFATGSAYCASKFAVLGLTESLMQEVRKSNVRVTAITPSTVATDLAVNAGLKIGDEDRMMQPEDVSELIISILKMPQRVFIKTAGIWTTNPQ
ncbi:3-ketoacyl-ACP reductase [Bacillus sp. AGMB 02131]|uniref:3-ketoacyl-ACP reductase n=1 Tax=Peribacillus faecalis TaxID=2772559 RepID=A0A927H9N5_9BACI|nr:3-ketoacyl-ACP reductase [Peribacillus faecalis]MBD3107780.1 3-ketoacyl-ACP reductase [Peribacillus faecalis]